MALFLNEAEAVRYRPYTNGDTPWYKQELKEPEDEFPVDYPVIDRGMDQDAISTLDVIGKTEKKLKHQMHSELVQSSLIQLYFGRHPQPLLSLNLIFSSLIPLLSS